MSSHVRNPDHIPLHERNCNPSSSSSSPKPNTANKGSVSLEQSKSPQPKNSQWLRHFAWITDNLAPSKLKPVVRCSVAIFLSVVLFVIPKVETAMGQASFILLIASVLSPPVEPFLAVLERETLILLFVGIAWAWSCLGIFLASLTRTTTIPNVDLYVAIDSAKYIEAAPSVILAIFSLGSGAFLYVRARQGSGPYFSACLFACVLIDISVTTAALVPFPYYAIGKAVVIPLTIHTGISLLCSVLIFPASISALFTNRLNDVVVPFISISELHRKILLSKPNDPIFTEQAQAIAIAVTKAESALTPLASTARLLPADLIYCRFAPTDFIKFHDLTRRLVVRANGMNLYFSLIDPTRPRFPITPLPSRISTPRMTTPAATRPPSIVNEESYSSTPNESNDSSPMLDAPRHQHHPHHSLLHVSLLKTMEPAVGLFESQRYLNLEANRFHEPQAEANIEQATALLQESCSDLLVQVGHGLLELTSWMDTVRHGRIGELIGSTRSTKMKEERLTRIKQSRSDLGDTLDCFQECKRLKVLDMYRPAIEGELRSLPPHRQLFHCFVYQYHLLRFSTNILDMLDEVIRLETERKHCRIWTPVERLFKWSSWELGEGAEFEDDENPDFVPGLDPSAYNILPGRRNPDALPPRNVFELLLNKSFERMRGVAHGNALFAMKAAILTLVLCLPAFIRSSAVFAYHNRFFWGIVLAQITLARFRGDTVFGMLVRVLATFIGGVIGLAMWYIGNGLGSGNPYGFAAIGAFAIPFLFFAKLYYPAPPIALMLVLLTTLLVSGYSYQQQQTPLPGNPGVGWEVAWRRFVVVTGGVVAAFIFSLLPPSTTIRSYQRKSLGTAAFEIGSIYCAIVSYANSHREEDPNKIIISLCAIRAKLNRFDNLRENASYEFSFRGRWPRKRYSEVSTLLLQISYNFSHLLSVIQRMEPAWARAFLKRTRLGDSTFQGDVLAVITMLSSALRTGTALPQITPCPLIDRFTFKYHGLRITTQDSEDDYGLPRELTMSTLSNEQYLYFCVGVSSSYALMARLDRLMLAVKQLVGEQYYIESLVPGY